MMLVVFCLLTLLCVWFVVRPHFLSVSEGAAQNNLAELRFSEREDLLRFLESLEFEKARGLIGEDEYAKQQAKVQKRLGKMSGEDA